jgi:hypothetical protein
MLKPAVFTGRRDPWNNGKLVGHKAPGGWPRELQIW